MPDLLPCKSYIVIDGKSRRNYGSFDGNEYEGGGYEGGWQRNDNNTYIYDIETVIVYQDDNLRPGWGGADCRSAEEDGMKV